MGYLSRGYSKYQINLSFKFHKDFLKITSQQGFKITYITVIFCTFMDWLWLSLKITSLWGFIITYRWQSYFSLSCAKLSLSCGYLGQLGFAWDASVNYPTLIVIGDRKKIKFWASSSWLGSAWLGSTLFEIKADGLAWLDQYQIWAGLAQLSSRPSKTLALGLAQLEKIN